MTACPLCGLDLIREMQHQGDRYDFLCQNCGGYNLSGSMQATLNSGQYSVYERAIMSHAIRRSGSHPLVTTVFAEAVLKNTKLPAAGEVLDNLLLYISDELTSPGEVLDLRARSIKAVIGAMSFTGVRWAVEQAIGLGLVEGNITREIAPDDRFVVQRATLTVSGWQRAEALLSEAKGSRKAFMAMKFGDAQLDELFRAQFKPAVTLTGFTLRRLDEEPRAGLLDDRLRLEIRASRFLIADLTHGNLGAYWEAGYAEGLGRPVIYTCRKDVFDDPSSRPHFDTNHHLTVVWNPAAVQDALAELKVVIRATLPAEAIMEDA